MGTRFQVCFTPLAGVLFAFPSRYWFTIGRRLVFRLGGWAPRIRTGFHVSRPTWDTRGVRGRFAYGAFTRCGRTFQTVPLRPLLPVAGSRNPGKQASRFGLFRFRSPLLAESLRFLFLGVLRCFTSPGVASSAYGFGAGWRSVGPPGCPIRTSTDHCRLRLPVAFRSSLRPSSPDGAKASVACPYTLSKSPRLPLAEAPAPILGIRCYLPIKLRGFQRTRPARPCRGGRGFGQRGGRPGGPGGRDWNRTSDLVLIRDAL